MDPELVQDTEEARKWLSRSHQPLFRSFCNFFGVAVDRNERKAVQFAEEANIEDAKYHVSVKKVKALSKTFLDLHAPLNSQLHPVWRLFRDLTTRSASKLFQKWFDHLFDNGLQSVVICQLNNGYSMLTGKQYENYAMRSANDDNVVGHLALAQYSCYSEDYDWKRAERHLRIAAEMGHGSTQLICRQLFGDREQISRGLNNSNSEEELRRELQNLRIYRDRLRPAA